LRLLTVPPSPRAPLLPYTTLFRSARGPVRLVKNQIVPWASRSSWAVIGTAPVGLLSSCTNTNGLSARLVQNLCLSAWVSVMRSRSEEHTSELQSRENLVCRLLLEK